MKLTARPFMLRSNRPFRVPLQVSIQYALALSTLARAFANVVVVLLIALGILVILFFLILLQLLLASTVFPALDSTVAGFIGVLVGAGISALVSNALQSGQFKAQALRSKKDLIYRPLYEGLVALAEVLKENPYPGHIVLKPQSDEHLSRSDPLFSSWSEISADGRRIEVPKWLTSATADKKLGKMV